MKHAIFTTLTLTATAAMVIGLCFAVNSRFLRDPDADSYMQTAEKVTSLSIYGAEALQRFRDEDEVTFDPTSGQRMGETIQYLKQSDKANLLVVGASQVAFVARDSSQDYYTRRVDQVLERLANAPIETYNLSSAGLNGSETALIIDKASKRVHFEHVIVFLLPHVLQYKTPRPELQNIPDPSPDSFTKIVSPSLLDRWLDPSAINAAVRDAASARLQEAMPFFRRRFPIQQWAAREMMRMEVPAFAAAGTGATLASPALSGQAPLLLNDGHGLKHPGVAPLPDPATAWVGTLPQTPVRLEHDPDLQQDVAVFPGGYNAMVLKQTVALSGDAGGRTLTLRAKMKSSDPRVYARIGLQFGDTPAMASHPGDGQWHEVTVQWTLPYSTTETSVAVILQHGNRPGQEMRVADLSLTSDESQVVYQYYFVDETVKPILTNLHGLLEHLDGYRDRTSAAVTVVLSPYYQDPENPVFQPLWMMDQFVEITRQYAQEHGFHFLDARSLVPNDCFGNHSNSPVIDGVHFDAEGHKILATELLRLLDL
jgi:hypothetical protein